MAYKPCQSLQMNVTCILHLQLASGHLHFLDIADPVCAAKLMHEAKQDFCSIRRGGFTAEQKVGL